jgi:hypothetical protein
MDLFTNHFFLLAMNTREQGQHYCQPYRGQHGGPAPKEKKSSIPFSIFASSTSVGCLLLIVHEESFNFTTETIGITPISLKRSF